MPADPVQILKTVYGYDAFRGRQAEIIAHVIAGNHAFVLMPTGGGKSLCYQKWTDAEDGDLLSMHARGTPIGELATHFQRQPSAIQSRLKKLSPESDMDPA